MRKPTTPDIRRRIADAEKAVGARWLSHVTDALADELRRRPEAEARAVISRLHGLQRRQGADPAARPGDDLATIVMRAVREISPAIADAVELRITTAAEDVTQ